MPISEFKKTLSKNGKKYSDEELLKIRDMMYILGEIDYLLYSETKSRKTEKEKNNG